MVRSFSIQFLLHPNQATRPGDLLQSQSIQNNCRIYPEIDPDFHHINYRYNIWKRIVFDISSRI